MPLFDAASRDIILNFKREHGYDSNDYVEISKLIPQYTPKQIRHYWTNTLDPRLNHSRLDKGEEKFIVTWIENRDPNGPINWGELINNIQQRFDKFRPKNKIKNFWYSRLRRQGGQVRSQIIERFRREFDSINQSTFTSRHFSSIHSSNNYSSIPNISYTSYSIPQPNSFQYPLQSNSIPHFTQIPQYRTIPNIHQPIPTIYCTLQPKPDPPQFNEPYRMTPI